MPKVRYFILLSNEGDFLNRIDENMWRATFDFDDATIFESFEEAIFYLNDMSIRSIWPQAKVK